MDEIINLIGNYSDHVIALSAISALVLNFITIRQVKKQHNSSYAPTLAITEIFFENHNLIIPSDWIRVKSTDEHLQNVSNLEIETAQKIPFFHIPLINIGLGTAKKIKIYWSFQIELMVNQINTWACQTNEDNYLKFEDEILPIKYNDRYYSAMWGNEKRNKIDFLLPVSNNNSNFLLNDNYLCRSATIKIAGC